MDNLTFMGKDEEGSSIYNATIKDALNKRILIINQEIDDDIIENYIYQIIRWNIEDQHLPVENRTKIKLLINSPGGDCIVGFSLVDVIKNSKTPIVAIGFGLVASMAYHIYISCYERYAFENTVLLQHDGEISVSNSTSKVKDTMKFFDQMEVRTKNHVLSCTSMSEEEYDRHYEQEWYFYADEEGKKYNCVDGIIGKDVNFEDIL